MQCILDFLYTPKMTEYVDMSQCQGIPGFYKGLCAMEKYLLFINSEGWCTLSKNGCKGIPLFFFAFTV